MTTGPVIEFNGYRIEEIEYKTIHDIDKSNFSVEPDLSFEFGLSEDIRPDWRCFKKRKKKEKMRKSVCIGKSQEDGINTRISYL